MDKSRRQNQYLMKIILLKGNFSAKTGDNSTIAVINWQATRNQFTNHLAQDTRIKRLLQRIRKGQPSEWLALT
ncbi:MAG: hypothetical protein JJU07_00125 [Natronohydrobacter sp.]|nr:hypothetical protein [Natronohydrobacter sp.]